MMQLISKIDGKWYETCTDVAIIFLGEYDAKLYYSDNYGINYIDLKKSNFEPVRWIDFEDYYLMTYGVMKDDTIYFEYEFDIVSLKTSAKSYDEITTVVSLDNDKDKLEFVGLRDNLLYYVTDLYNSSEYVKNNVVGDFCVYDINSKQTKVIEKDVDSIQVNDDKILVYKYDVSDYKSKYYLYGIESTDIEYIPVSSENSVFFYDNQVYYINEDTNSILKYVNGSFEEVYKCIEKDNKGNLYHIRGFDIYNNGILKIYLMSGNDIFVENGNVISREEVITKTDSYSINMIDGTTKVLNQIDLVK